MRVISKPVGSSVKQDRRSDADRPIPFRRLGDEERKNIVETCNRTEFASLPPSHIVPALTDGGEYIGSEATVYRALKGIGQLNH